MLSARKPLLALFLVGLFVGSCVFGDDPTGVRSGEIGLAIQPALIPSAADGTALPINRIRAVVTRQPGDLLLREQSFDVSPAAASWTIDVSVPVTGDEVEVVVYLYLLNVSGGTESVQFSGRTDPISVRVGQRLVNVDADIVRGPLENLAVTAVAITSGPDTVYVGETGDFAASVTTSGSAPEVFWTSLDPSVLLMVDSVGTGVSAGTAEVVASAGAFADTVVVEVVDAAVDSVRVLPDSADVQEGLTRAYAAALFDVNGNPVTRPVTWETGNAGIATVNASGVVTGVAPGVTTVTATSEGISDQAIVRVTPAPTGGATNVWTATGDGIWSSASNWSQNRPPAPADTVLITQGTDYVVTLDVPDTVAKVVVGAGVTLNVGSQALSMTGTGEGPELDIQAGGTVEIANGSIRAGGITNSGTVRGVGDAVAFIEADSVVNDGEWHLLTGGMVFGIEAGPWFRTDSLLVVESAATIQWGPFTDLLYEGGSWMGDGLLLLSQGAELQLFENFAIDGPDLALQGASIVENDSESVTIGVESLLELLTTAPDQTEVRASPLTIVGEMFVIGPGARAEGTLVVAEGAYLSVAASGGPTVFRTGDVSNSGVLSLDGLADVTFGPGAGTIVNNSTGEIETFTIDPARIVIDGQLENYGSVVIDGRTELIRQDAAGAAITAQHLNAVEASVEIFGGASLHIALGGTGATPPSFENEGAILVEEGATLSAENLTDPPGQIIATSTATFEGSGTVDLTGAAPGMPNLTGSNDGVIRPGSFFSGILTWKGSIPMGPAGTGVIEIAIDGVEPGTEFDQLNVTGQLVLDGLGTLDVNFGSYSPFSGDRFPILSYGTRVGDFGSVALPSINGVLDTLTVETPDISAVVPDTFVVVVVEGPSPVAADWPLDEGSGDTAFDVLGDGNPGTLGTVPGQTDPQNPAWIQGRVGSALSFGGGQVVQVPDDASLEPSEFTVEAFVRGTSPAPNTYILAKGGGPGSLENAAYALYTGSTGGLEFYTTIDGSLTFYPSSYIAPSSIWDGNWHHVAATFNGFELAIWVDGVQVGPANFAYVGYATPSQDLAIGALHPSGAFGFTGDIDEVRIWKRPLTAAEIQARASRGGP